MTRDEAIDRLKQQGMNISWAAGMVDSLVALELLVFDEDKQKPQDMAIQAYEEAMKSNKAMDDL